MKSGGGRGRGGRSSKKGSGSVKGSYIGFGRTTVKNTYSHHYYGGSSASDTCLPEDEECLADLKKRERDTWIMIGSIIGALVLIITGCCIYRGLCKALCSECTAAAKNKVEIKASEQLGSNR